MWGSDTSTTSAPASRSQSAPRSHSDRMSASVPSIRYSRGRPTRLPVRSAFRPFSQAGTGRSSEVASRGSNPAIASSTAAQSATVRAIGPA